MASTTANARAATASVPAQASGSESSSALKPVTKPTKKMPEQDALQAVRTGLATGASTRQLATLTGWSLGWVTGRAQEFRTAIAVQYRDELDVLGECVEALSDLDPGARTRALRYLNDRFSDHRH